MILPDAIDHIRPSVVQFCAYNETTRNSQVFGSGFILNDSGHVATAAHVVNAATNLASAGNRISVGLAYPNMDDGSVMMATNFHHVGAIPLGVNPLYDVAVLLLDPNPFENPPRPMIQIGDFAPPPLFQSCCTSTDRPRDGESIAVSGYPLNSSTMITTAGNLASGWASHQVVLTDANGNPQRETLQIYLADISVNPGNSGGPAYRLDDGCVIGVCTAYQSSSVFFADQQNCPADVNGRPLAVNSGLALVTPINHVLQLLEQIQQQQQSTT